jgi:hypothetical protein
MCLVTKGGSTSICMYVCKCVCFVCHCMFFPDRQIQARRKESTLRLDHVRGGVWPHVCRAGSLRKRLSALQARAEVSKKASKEADAAMLAAAVKAAHRETGGAPGSRRR